jgi:hypothetical protein
VIADDGAAALLVKSYPEWRERLAKANDPAFWPITAIDAELDAGRAQFWCDGAAALVTRIVEYPGGAVALEALAAAGDMGTLIGSLCIDVENKARPAGITHLLVAGRSGWLRKLAGWRPYQTVIVKELGDG